MTEQEGLQTIRIVADTVEEAQARALHKAPVDTEVISSAVVQSPGLANIEVEAADEQGARSQVEADIQQADGLATAVVRAVRPAGAGRYQVELRQRAVIDTTYRIRTAGSGQAEEPPGETMVRPAFPITPTDDSEYREERLLSEQRKPAGERGAPVPQEQNGETILATVDSVLAGRTLSNAPRVFLLLQMCRLSLLAFPDRTAHYWLQLRSLQIPPELEPDFKALRHLMEPAAAVIESPPMPQAKGFAAEIVASVEAAKKLIPTDIEEAKRRLLDCEVRLQKRHWPFGKGPAWQALARAWAGIDRPHALQLLKHVDDRAEFIRRIYPARPFLPEEWKIVVDGVGTFDAPGIVLQLLDDGHTQFSLPRKLALAIGETLREQVIGGGYPGENLEKQMLDTAIKGLARYFKFIDALKDGNQPDLIPTLLTELYVQVANTDNWKKVWPIRFPVLTIILDNMVRTEWFTDQVLEDLLTKTPAQLVGFVRSHCAALQVKTPDEIEAAHRALVEKSHNHLHAEAWFLVSLVKRGLGAEALSLAQQSRHAADLVPRLQRAWLCEDPEAARSAISANVSADPIREFLAQRTVQDRIAYLRKVTANGARSVPGSMWFHRESLPELKVFPSFGEMLQESGVLRDETPQLVSRYLAQHPQYSSYGLDTAEWAQFTEFVRVEGYDDYSLKAIDRALLEALVVWSDENAKEVESLLREMWEDTPKQHEKLLRSGLVRSALLERCRVVFAANLEMLLTFLAWFKKNLVDLSISWKQGEAEFRIKYPKETPLLFCVEAATAMSPLSPERRDQILVAGLEKFWEREELAASAPFRSLVEAAAQLYNQGKEMFDLAPPRQFPPDLVEAWQLGIVKNAMPQILAAVATQRKGL